MIRILILQKLHAKLIYLQKLNYPYNWVNYKHCHYVIHSIKYERGLKNLFTVFIKQLTVEPQTRVENSLQR